MVYYLTDTHSLIWYLTEDKRLGKKASEIFNKIDEGEETLIVPTIVLAELIYACEKKNVDLKIRDVINKINKSLNYLPYNLDMEVLDKVIFLKDISEIHDRIIMAIALLTESILITKDKDIINSRIVRTLW